jgi:3-phosphoglycerate kinase
MKSIKSHKIFNKTVMLRVDFNLPINDGKVLSSEDYRIRAVLPTIEYLLKNKNKIILVSHLGRPNGQWNNEYTLKPITKHIEELLGENIAFIGEDIRTINELSFNSVCLLENIRFYPEEENDDNKFAEKLSSFADVFVNDAFSVCHRAHASVHRITEFLPSFAGISLEKEIEVLDKAIENPTEPLSVIIGGLKAETKIKVIGNFLPKADFVMLGGVLANTILSARGVDVGKSIISQDVISDVKKMKVADIKIYAPVDAVVSKDIDGKSGVRIIPIDNVKDDDIILDIGPKTINEFRKILEESKMVIWNGPVGKADNELFSEGTKAIARTISDLDIYSIVGGGDTIAILHQMGLIDNFTYISTGGGAMLEYLAGNKMPGIEALRS